MITIQKARANTIETLNATSDTASLDATLLLSQATGLSHASLFAHSERALTEQQAHQLTQWIKRRLQGEPIAYIIGHTAFWNLTLNVTPDVLIPRPETECLIEWILTHYRNDEPLTAADLGVGSGAIALTLATERPNWQLHASDCSSNAIKIAKQNAHAHQIRNVHFFQGRWCTALPHHHYDIIVSNPPYIDSNDPHLNTLVFEPIGALDGGTAGLDAIRIIIDEAKGYLKKSGLLIFEHGYDQRESILLLLKAAGYTAIDAHNDLADLPRFSTAQRG